MKQLFLHFKRLFVGATLVLGLAVIVLAVLKTWEVYPITFLLSIFLPLAYYFGKAVLHRNPEL